MSHKKALEEIKLFLSHRKREETDYLRHLIKKEEESGLDQEGIIEMRATESKILLIEEMGNRFFRWE